MTAWIGSRHTRTFAALALALPLLGAGGPRIASLEGEVERGAGQPPAWREARIGELLFPGERIRTGAGGRAELALGGHTVRMSESTTLRLPA